MSDQGDPIGKDGLQERLTTQKHAIDQIWQEGLEPKEGLSLKNILLPLQHSEFAKLIEEYPELSDKLEVVKELLNTHQILRLVAIDRRGDEQTKNHLVMFCRPKNGFGGTYKTIIFTAIDTNQIDTKDSVGVFVLSSQKSLLEKLGIEKDSVFNIYHVVYGKIKKAKQQNNTLVAGIFFFQKLFQYSTLVRFPKSIFTFLQTTEDINILEGDQQSMVRNIQRTGIRSEEDSKEAKSMTMLNLTHGQLRGILNGES